MRRRWQLAADHPARRAIALVALAAFAAASLDVPVPISQGKDLSRPFPCMYRRCGCQHADQCWGGCCCFTNSQKLAWSKKHRVQPPHYVVTAARRETPRVDKPSACCGKAACPTKGRAQAAVAEASSAAGDLGLLSSVSARHCRGQAELWLTLGAVAPLPAKLAVSEQSPPCGEIAAAVFMLSSIHLPLATPPPRLAL